MTQQLYDSLVFLLGEPLETMRVADDDIVGYWQPITDRTLGDCVYGNPKGSFDHVCINRISANIEFMHVHMHETGIMVPEFHKTRLYLRTDYIKADEYNSLVDKVLGIAELCGMTEGLPRKVPELTALLYTDVNDLESVTFTAKVYDETISATFLQSNEVFSGEW